MYVYGSGGYYPASRTLAGGDEGWTMKAYCSHCKYFLRKEDYGSDMKMYIYICRAPQNTTSETIEWDDWERPHMERYVKRKASPQRLNKNNDCPYYVVKE